MFLFYSVFRHGWRVFGLDELFVHSGTVAVSIILLMDR